MKRIIVVFVLNLLLFSCVSHVTKKASTVPEGQKPAYSVWTTLYILKDQTPLYRAPQKNAAILNYLQDGDQVRVLDNRNGWYKITSGKNKTGWIRSNVAGPRWLSRTAMAAAFNDSIMNHFDAKLFIDKNHPYRVIYLETTQPNISKAKKMARRVGKAYQQKVYPGKLTINLIRPGKKKYFAQVVLKAKGLAKIPVPVIYYGYLDKLKVMGKTVRLIVRVPRDLGTKALLKLARKISSAYAYPFTKSTILIRPMGKGNKCLLYYIEDEYGEDYAFGKCGLH